MVTIRKKAPIICRVAIYGDHPKKAPIICRVAIYGDHPKKSANHL